VRQEVFERSRLARWERIESLLDSLEKGVREDATDFPSLYRGLCQDLALARERGFSGSLVQRLNDLALRGHEQLYGAERNELLPLIRASLEHVPASVRAHRGMLIFVSLFFVAITCATAWHSYHDRSFVYSVLQGEHVKRYESMYGPDRELGRSADTGALMFGFYIQNNITIDFRAFASGLALGIGSLFLVAFNSVHLGALAGHLAYLGYGDALGSFVVGHGAFEIPALLVCAAAGTALGLSWLAPGHRSRLGALRHAATSTLPLVGVAGVMGVIAALLEAFWSPLDVGSNAKYTVGALLWSFVIGGFVLLGRARAS
jgi:uncharacterized membrane protein SpoIIM required for sporulation